MKMKRVNAYAEAKGISLLWAKGEKEGAVEQALRPGPSKALRPALTYYYLNKDNPKAASDFLKAVVDRMVRP